MSLPTWPVTLPLTPLVDGYEETWYSQTEYKTPSNGAPMVRRTQVLSMRIINVKFVLTAAQVETLYNFIYKTLDGGAKRFSWMHPRTKEDVEMSFYGKDSSSDLVTIGEPQGTQYKKNPDGVYYSVSTTLVIWP